MTIFDSAFHTPRAPHIRRTPRAPHCFSKLSRLLPLNCIMLRVAVLRGTMAGGATDLTRPDLGRRCAQTHSEFAKMMME